MNDPVIVVQQRLKKSLARTKAFQEFTGKGETGSLGKIYFDGLPASSTGEAYTRTELDAYRPYAVIGVPAVDPILRYEAVGAFEEYQIIGSIDLMLVRGVTAAQIRAGMNAIVQPIHSISGRIIASYDTDNPGLLELLQADPGDNFRFRGDPMPQVMGTTRNSEEDSQRYGDETFTWLRFSYGS